MTRFSRIAFQALFIYTLNCGAGHTKAAAQANIPLEGTFSRDNWNVRLDNKSGTGSFIKVGNAAHKPGDQFLKVNSRSNYNTWHGRVYEQHFETMTEGTVSIKGNRLIITPNNVNAYVLIRMRRASSSAMINSQPTIIPVKPVEEIQTIKRNPGRSKITRSSGAGCATVQCHGITRAGNRCSRTTTNCSGNCWQH